LLYIPFKIAAKLLQMDTWLLLKAHRKLPYLMAPSQIPCDLPFSHNTARLVLHSALWPFKVIQGQWFISFESQYATFYCEGPENMQAGPDAPGHILHRLATVHPW